MISVIVCISFIQWHQMFIFIFKYILIIILILSILFLCLLSRWSGVVVRRCTVWRENFQRCSSPSAEKESFISTLLWTERLRTRSVRLRTKRLGFNVFVQREEIFKINPNIGTKLLLLLNYRPLLHGWVREPLVWVLNHHSVCSLHWALRALHVLQSYRILNT